MLVSALLSAIEIGPKTYAEKNIIKPKDGTGKLLLWEM
jgi:hypothetical protein